MRRAGMRAAAALGVAAVMLGLGGGPATAGTSGATVVFHLSDPRLDEVSGVAVGIASPGIDYVQNDGGDSARFFALDARTGRTVATYAVPGATNVDWEDIALARDAHGTPSLWLGDIGDNDAVRKSITIYRVNEPRVAPGGPSARTTDRPQTWRLRYASGPVNAESLAVAPGGAAYIFTKSFDGDTSVYAVPASAAGGRVQTLRKIGAITFHLTGTPDPLSIIGGLTATGAALSPDGSVLAVRTYSDAYFWPVRGGDVAAALKSAPVRIPLPQEPQGEGITFDGARVLLDSEHTGTAVYAVPIPKTVPALAATPRAPAATPSGSGASSAAAAPASSSATNHPSGPASASSSSVGSSISRRSPYALILLLILAGVWAGSLELRRRWRGRRSGN